MTINKLTDNIYPLNNTNKINEIIDAIDSIPPADSELSPISENPVQNKVIYSALEDKQDISNMVTEITDESTNSTYPSSKAVYDTVQNAEYGLEVQSYTDEALALAGITSTQDRVKYLMPADKLPLFYSTWSPTKMPDCWIKSTEAFLSRSTYPKQYDYLLSILNGETTDTGLSVKSSTDTYDDFDFVLNTTEHTFRLPLFNGEEDRVGQVLSVDLVDLSAITDWDNGFNWTAPYNCIYQLEVIPPSSHLDIILYAGISGQPRGFYYVWSNPGNQQMVQIKLNKGESIYISGYKVHTLGKVNEHVYKFKGNGDLYFLVNNSKSEEIAPKDPNFIPKDTVIHVELDGSGDFDNLNDAIDFLTGKWSNGKVYIDIGAGTFDLDKTVFLSGDNFNIPNLYIMGSGIDTTIIKATTELSGKSMIQIYTNCYVCLQDVTLDGNNKQAGNGLNCEHFAIAEIVNIKIKDCNWGMFFGWNSKGDIAGIVTIENCNTAIECQNHAFLTFRICTITMTNVTLGFTWFRISEISIIASTYTFTNVATRAVASLNTYSARGICQADNTF